MITNQYTENQWLSYTNPTRNQGVNLGAPEGWPAPAPKAAPIELLWLQTRCIFSRPMKCLLGTFHIEQTNKIKKWKQNYPRHEINAFTNHNLRSYKQISINNSCSSQLYNLQSIHTTTNVHSIVSCTSILCYVMFDYISWDGILFNRKYVWYFANRWVLYHCHYHISKKSLKIPKG